MSYWNGSSWAPAGFNGTVVANPQYPLRKAVSAVTSVAHVYAVFLNDADGDGIRDERDNCPLVVEPRPAECRRRRLRRRVRSVHGHRRRRLRQSRLRGEHLRARQLPVDLEPNADRHRRRRRRKRLRQLPARRRIPPRRTPTPTTSATRATPTHVCRSRTTWPTRTTSRRSRPRSTPRRSRGRGSGSCPGTVPYLESVSSTATSSSSSKGWTTSAHTPVVVDGGGGIAFDVVTTAGGGRVSFDNLTIRGATGIRSAVSTTMEDLTFEQATSLAVDLERREPHAGSDPDGLDGGVGDRHGRWRLADAAQLALRVVVGHGASPGRAVDGRDGARSAAERGTRVVALSTANLTLRHATIAGNGGKGVDNTAGGAVTIAHAIVQDNAGGDLANVACPSIAWSNVKSQDCTGTGNDLHTTCALAADYPAALVVGLPRLRSIACDVHRLAVPGPRRRSAAARSRRGRHRDDRSRRLRASERRR